MGDEDDRLAELTLEALQLALQLLAHDRVDGAEGLVHEQDVRVGGEAAGDADSLLLAAGELGGIAGGELRVEAHGVHELAGPLARLALRGAAQHGDGGDVVQHGAVGQQARGLHDVADGAAQRDGIHPRDVLAVDGDASGGGVDHPVDHAHEGGLAGAGGAHERDRLVGGDLEGEVLDRERAARILLADVLETDHGAS